MACWAQAYGGVRGQVHEIASAQGRKVTRAQVCKNMRAPEAQRCKSMSVTWVQVHEGLRVQGCMKAQGCKDARAQEPKGIRGIGV